MSNLLLETSNHNIKSFTFNVDDLCNLMIKTFSNQFYLNPALTFLKRKVAIFLVEVTHLTVKVNLVGCLEKPMCHYGVEKCSEVVLHIEFSNMSSMLCPYQMWLVCLILNGIIVDTSKGFICI